MRSILILLLLPAFALAEPKVSVMRVPDGGIEPQAVTSDGVIHLIYFKGDEQHGDIFYIHSDDGEKFTTPMRVNTEPGSALAVGAVRGAQLAVGKSGRVHVVWNGARGNALFYARLESRTFEPQRNLAETHSGLDGGGSVAADQDENVYIVWHAPSEKNGDEASRRVWLAKSDDDGKNFSAEIPISKNSGACACCAMRAGVDDTGWLYILYRSAEEKVHRDMHMLLSTDHGDTFEGGKFDEWTSGQCVMSTSAVASGNVGFAYAWESNGKIIMKVGNFEVIAPGEGKNRKHPAIAVNKHDEELLAWTEGTGWNKGGSVAWRVCGVKNVIPVAPLGEKNGYADGLPIWGWVTAFAKPDGSFVVVY